MEDFESKNSWVWAILLILVGSLWLLHKMGILFLDRWWSFLFLIPAIALFADAWSLFHKHSNRLTRGVMDAISGGFFFVLLTIFFYMNQSAYWKLFLPILLILAGISALINAFLLKK